MKYGKAYLGDVLISDPSIAHNEDTVRFYDYDGSLLYEYDLDAAKQLTSLPEPPDHTEEGLRFLRWNWTLEQVTSISQGFADVGALYTTIDGNTHLHIHIENPEIDYVILFAQKKPGTMRIDWGDGSEPYEQSSRVTKTFTSPAHVYPHRGDYIINISNLLGAGEGNRNILNKQSSDVYSILRKAYFPEDFMNFAGYHALQYMNNLEVVCLPAMNAIGQESFQECRALKYFVVSDNKYYSDGYIGEFINTFTDCNSLKGVSFPKDSNAVFGTSWASNTLIERLRTPACSSVVVPTLVRHIDISACAVKDSLYFSALQCRGLEKVVFPDIPIVLSGQNFRYCTSLREVVFPQSHEVQFSGNYIFDNCKALRSLKNLIIGGTTLPPALFGGLIIPEMEIPGNIVTVGTNIFYNSRIYRIVLNEGLTGIPNNFAPYANLSTITIPSTVTSIGSQAFYANNSLKEIHLKPTTPPSLTNVNAFSNISSTPIFYVPAGSLEAYQTATNWSSYAQYMVEESE